MAFDTRPSASAPMVGYPIDASQAPYRNNLQCAVDAAAAGGGIVYLPPLDGADDAYVVPEPPLRIWYANMAIIGGGPQSRIRFPPGGPTLRPGRSTRTPLVEIEAPDPGACRVLLEALYLDIGRDLESEKRPDLFVGIHIHPDNAAPVHLRDLTIGSADVSQPYAIGVELRSGDTPLTLDGVKIRQCSLTGLAACPASPRRPRAQLEIRNSTVEGCGTGVLVDGIEGIAVRHSTVALNDLCGIEALRSESVAIEGCSLEGNVRRHEGASAPPAEDAQIRLGEGCRYATVRGCYISGGGVRSPSGVAVLSGGYTSIVANALDNHGVTDVYVGAGAGPIYPDPTEAGGARLLLNSRSEGIDPDLPHVIDARTRAASARPRSG